LDGIPADVDFVFFSFLKSNRNKNKLQFRGVKILNQKQQSKIFIPAAQQWHQQQQ
jgi:hypothetical protein